MFWRRRWRENDYLWGRLDGAERLLWLIDEGNSVAEKEVFRAIAADEQDLRKAKKLLRQVESYVGGP